MTDSVLMQKVKEGDLTQAAMLFHRYHRKIYHYLGKMSGDYHIAEDLTQTAFEKLIQYRNSFDSNQNFEGWIFRIAKNSYLDYTQKLKKSPTRTPLEDHMGEIANDDHESDKDEKEEKLHKALEALPMDYKEVLVLTRFQKMKYHEVAALLNTTESNIKIKVFRAIEKLRTNYFHLESI
ncbi:MAG: sigma-70 family RNA polymerase sigma factor [Saprospiraceae bacterium]